MYISTKIMFFFASIAMSYKAFLEAEGKLSEQGKKWSSQKLKSKVVLLVSEPAFYLQVSLVVCFIVHSTGMAF